MTLKDLCSRNSPVAAVRRMECGVSVALRDQLGLPTRREVGVLDFSAGSSTRRPGWVVPVFGRWPQQALGLTGVGLRKRKGPVGDSPVFDLNNRVDDGAVFGDGGLEGSRL